jgi:hypothetical protein
MARAVFRKIFFFGLLAVTAMVFAVGPASAQVPRCAPRGDLVSTLSEKYKETQNAYGWIGPQAILEVFASEKGGWTVVVTGADGVSCVLAVGIGWENMQPPVSGTSAHTGM